MASTHVRDYVPETSTLRLITCFFGETKECVCKSPNVFAARLKIEYARVSMQKPERVFG